VTEVRKKILDLQRSSRRVAVLGAGAVGTALAKALTEWKVAVSLYEQQSRNSYFSVSPFGKCTQDLESQGVSLRFERQELRDEEIAEYELVLPSP
jgi:ketopantoate reductase